MPRKTKKGGASARNGVRKNSQRRKTSRSYSRKSSYVSRSRSSVGHHKEMLNKKILGDCETKMERINGVMLRVPEHMAEPLKKISIRNGLPPMRTLGSKFESLRKDYVKKRNPKTLLQLILILLVLQDRWGKYTKTLGFPEVHKDIQKIEIVKSDFNLENEIENVTPEQVKDIKSEEIEKL